MFKSEACPQYCITKEQGNIRIGGKVLSSTRKRQVRKTIKVETEKVKAVLLTNGGVVVYDDFILQRHRKILHGKRTNKSNPSRDNSKRDIVGNNLGSQEVRSILERKEGIEPERARLLTFVPHGLEDFNGSTTKLKLETRLEELSKISTSRITPTLFYQNSKHLSLAK